MGLKIKNGIVNTWLLFWVVLFAPLALMGLSCTLFLIAFDEGAHLERYFIFFQMITIPLSIIATVSATYVAYFAVKTWHKNRITEKNLQVIWFGISALKKFSLAFSQYKADYPWLKEGKKLISVNQDGISSFNYCRKMYFLAQNAMIEIDSIVLRKKGAECRFFSLLNGAWSGIHFLQHYLKHPEQHDSDPENADRLREQPKIIIHIIDEILKELEELEMKDAV